MIFILVGLSVCAYSQTPVRAGALPAVNLSIPVNSLWKVQANAEHRAIQRPEHRMNGPAPDWGWTAERLDLSVFASRRFRIDQSFAAGYMLRFSEREPIHRFRQQWTRVFREYSFRWAYRMATDQTFRPASPTEYRWRHRFTIEVPLSGQVVDPREFYFKANNEYLFMFTDASPQWESRWVPLLGYTFSDRNKIEGGIDYRRESRAERPALHSFWWTVQWYVSL